MGQEEKKRGKALFPQVFGKNSLISVSAAIAIAIGSGGYILSLENRIRANEAQVKFHIENPAIHHNKAIDLDNKIRSLDKEVNDRVTNLDNYLDKRIRMLEQQIIFIQGIREEQNRIRQRVGKVEDAIGK